MTTSDAIAVTAFATTSFMLGIYQTGLCSGPTGRSGSCSAFETLYAASVPAAYEVSSALSLFLAVFAVVTFYLAIASLRTDLVLTVIIWLIFVGLVLLSIGFGTSSGNVVKAGGWVVLVFAVLAWYHAVGDVIAATFGRKILPFGPPPVK